MPLPSKPRHALAASPPLQPVRSAVSSSVDVTVKSHMLTTKTEARSEKPTGDQSEGASCAQDEDDEEVGKTPTKRAKVVKKEKNEEFSFF